MQTFVPLTSSFEDIARTLDRARLNKQALEGWQILMTLLELDPQGNHRAPKGWVNHPAVKMWRGHEMSLYLYIQAMVDEWKNRGYNSTIGDKAKATIQTAIRSGVISGAMSTPPSWVSDMDKFKEVRKMLDDAGISVYAYKPNAFSERNSDAEVESALRAAKVLGAKSVTVELPTSSAQTQRLGALGEKHKIYFGYHTHLQVKDTVYDEALAQNPYNSINLDCGHYIAVGAPHNTASLLAFIEAKHDRITSMHIKDRTSKEHGAGNLEWGKGDTPLKEVLTLLKTKKYKFPATIELEYEVPAGSTAVAEVKKCVEYAKNILA